MHSTSLSSSSIIQLNLVVVDFVNQYLIQHYFSPGVRKSRYWGEMHMSPINCYDVTKPPYLLSGELCTSPLHSNRLYVYTICCRRGGQCFSVLRTRHPDVVGDSSGRSYVTEQGHNVPRLRTRVLASLGSTLVSCSPMSPKVAGSNPSQTGVF